jgi:tetratricopeptide (TPR) repeat protein
MLPVTLVLATGLAFQNGAAAQPVASTEAPAPAPVKREIAPQERGDIYMARKQFREAIEMYQKVPETAIVLNKIGIAYHQLTELESALKYYQRAVKKDPMFTDAMNNMGTIFYTRRNYRRAITEYKKVIRIRPDSSSTWANLANAYYQRKQFELSSQAVEKALELDPKVFESRSGSGSVVQERSVEDRAQYHYYLAKSFAKKGLNTEALIYIRKALEEGFKEKQKFQKEPEFSGLQKDPEFLQIMSMEIKAL